MPLALDDASLSVVLSVAELVPPNRRNDFLERVAEELAAQPTVGPGITHRIAYQIAREIGMQVSARHRPTRMVDGKSKLMVSGK